MTPKEKLYHNLYMDIADRYSQMSYAVRSKVGAIAVKGGNTIGHGWNGMPSGYNNTCEHQVGGGLVTNPEVHHAEENMLMKMLRAGISSEGASVYLTLEPCLPCAKLLYGSGFSSVYYRDSYRLHDGLDFLAGTDVKVEQL
jgi:dCMP deaminase